MKVKSTSAKVGELDICPDLCTGKHYLRSAYVKPSGEILKLYGLSGQK